MDQGVDTSVPKSDLHFLEVPYHFFGADTDQCSQHAHIFCAHANQGVNEGSYLYFII